MTQTELTTSQILEALQAAAASGIITFTTEDPVKAVDKIAKSKNGERVEVGAMKGLELVSRYASLGNSFKLAKEAFDAVQDEVKEILGDATELHVEGLKDPIATFRWGAKTSFDKDALRVEAPALVQKYTSTDPEGTRTFRFPGVKASTA